MNDPLDITFPGRFLREDGRRTATANERQVLALLSRHASASRADLMRQTGLTAQSITRLVDPLIERGLLLEGTPEIAGRGKPSAKLRLNPEAAFSVGLSVMTDALAMVLLDLAGNIRGQVTERLVSTELDGAIEQIGALIAQATQAAGLPPERRIGIGMGVTGYFIGEGTRLNPPRQLDPWALVPLDAILAERLGGPVLVDNDGNVAAVGEAMLGAGRGVPHFAYLYFAAGFGGGAIVNGQPLRGAYGNAGEFGSILPLDWPSPSLEDLRRFLVEHGQKWPDLHTMLEGLSADDPLVDAWLDRCAPSLDLTASAIFAAFDPDLIVLGGRLPTWLAERMAARITLTNPERRGHRRPMPRFVASQLPSHAAALGAAMLPLRAAFFQVS